MIIPIFGRIYGNIEGLFNTLQYLQKNTGNAFHSVLQLGDMGYVKEKERLEKMQQHEPRLIDGTQRFLTNSELYNRYFINAVGEEKLNCKVTFIEGFNDDHTLLQSLRGLHPVSSVCADSYRVLQFLPTGEGIAYYIDQAREAHVEAFGYNAGTAREIEKDLPPTADVLISYGEFNTNKEAKNSCEKRCKEKGIAMHLYGTPNSSSSPASPSVLLPTFALSAMPTSLRPYEENKDFFGCIQIDTEENYTFISGKDFLAKH